MTNPYFNDHDAATADLPLVIDSSQFLTLQYNTNDFDVIDGKLKLKDGHGDASLDKFIAAEVITEIHKVVAVNNSGQIIQADYTNVDHVDRVVGIALSAAGIGSEVVVQKFGRITNSSWSWTIGKGIFFDENGSLTQDVPQTGFWMNVAKPVAEDTIEVLLRLPVIRATPPSPTTTAAPTTTPGPTTTAGSTTAAPTTTVPPTTTTPGP